MLDQKYLWRTNEGGYAAYRIPSLTVTPTGALLAICEARRNSIVDEGDIDLVARRSTDGGTTWSDQ